LILTLLAAVLAACASRTGPPSPEPPPRAEAPVKDAETELEEQTRAVIVAHRPRLRACYEESLVKKPDQEGRVVLVIDVGQTGKAERVLEARREGLDDEVVHCLARVLKTIPFHDGAARTIRIQVPFAFSRQK
jgi:outer membrane biosynthesis protein TonB